MKVYTPCNCVDDYSLASKSVKSIISKTVTHRDIRLKINKHSCNPVPKDFGTTVNSFDTFEFLSILCIDRNPPNVLLSQ